MVMKSEKLMYLQLHSMLISIHVCTQKSEASTITSTITLQISNYMVSANLQLPTCSQRLCTKLLARI